jgi:hypothetical protein
MGLSWLMIPVNETLPDFNRSIHAILGIRMLQGGHAVATSPADMISQWFDAGGMVQFYDFNLDTYMNVGRLTLICCTSDEKSDHTGTFSEQNVVTFDPTETGYWRSQHQV